MRRFLVILGGFLLVAIALFFWPAFRGDSQDWTAPSPVPLVDRPGGAASPSAPLPGRLPVVARVEPREGGGDQTVAPVAATPPGPEAERDAIPGEYVFSFYDRQDRDAFIRLCESMGIDVLDRLDFGNAVRIRALDPNRRRELLAQAPTPVAESPNHYVRIPEDTVSDPRAEQTGYVGFGPNWLPWLGVSDGHDAWGEGVTVAVLDTPVAAHASLLSPRGAAAPGGGQSVQLADPLGHGTAVASLIAGQREGGVAGIAPAAQILSIPVLGQDGSGDAFSLAKGILLAVEQGADIINLSLGTHGDSFIVRDAVARAQEEGVILVSATGNDAVRGVSYPAKYDGVVAVSAVDAMGRHLFFANRGDEVDMAAPGIALTAAATSTANGVTNFSGTSAAAPLVAGALAALLSRDEDLTGEEAVALLRQYSDDAGEPGRDEEFGDGILDVARVMERDVSGIYDVAVGYPYVRGGQMAGVDPTIVVYAQNRGTESLSAVELTVTVEGVTESQVFYDVAVSEVVMHEFVVATRLLAVSPTLNVRFGATIRGATDARPGNNNGTATITVDSKDP